jgi:hypothetical protein
MNSQTMKELLLKNKKETYQLDTTFGSIRIGYLFDKQFRSAAFIELDSNQTCKLVIYKELNKNWIKVFEQDSIESSDPRLMIGDYNFDNKIDLALMIDMSLGTSIIELKLWLNENDSEVFHYIPNFEKIGTPTIDSLNKKIYGFNACCVFQELSLNEYRWNNNNLVLIKRTDIKRYDNKVEAVEKQFQSDNSELPIKETNIKMTLKDIDRLIKKYSKLKN